MLGRSQLSPEPRPPAKAPEAPALVEIRCVRGCFWPFGRVVRCCCGATVMRALRPEVGDAKHPCGGRILASGPHNISHEVDPVNCCPDPSIAMSSPARCVGRPHWVWPPFPPAGLWLNFLGGAPCVRSVKLVRPNLNQMRLDKPARAPLLGQTRSSAIGALLERFRQTYRVLVNIRGASVHVSGRVERPVAPDVWPAVDEHIDRTYPHLLRQKGAVCAPSLHCAHVLVRRVWQLAVIGKVVQRSWHGTRGCADIAVVVAALARDAQRRLLSVNIAIRGWGLLSIEQRFGAGMVPHDDAKTARPAHAPSSDSMPSAFPMHELGWGAARAR